LRKLLITVVLLGIAGFAGYFVLTAPATWVALHPSRNVADAGPPDLENGHALFYAGSCGTCHATPGQANETLLGGGLALVSNFGTFHMPNISPDTTNGIGGWTPATAPPMTGRTNIPPSPTPRSSGWTRTTCATCSPI
jgi:mono/diheme cytochrome c family protein